MYKLHYPEKISKAQAIDKITMHALFGENQNPKLKSRDEVAQLLKKKNVDINEFVESCRYYKNVVPDFEEMAGTGLWDVSKGVTMKVYDKETGTVINEMKGPGKIGLYDYKEKFAYALGEKDRAVQESKLTPFHSAIVFGIAAIESFMNTQAAIWNDRNPNELIVDSTENKVNIETKIIEWLPLMSTYDKINTGSKDWSCFKDLKKIRDEEIIHSRTGATGIDYYTLAKQIDKFRFGMGKLLGELHRCYGLAVPSSIINAVCYPDVEVIEVET